MKRLIITLLLATAMLISLQSCRMSVFGQQSQSNGTQARKHRVLTKKHYMSRKYQRQLRSWKWMSHNVQKDSVLTQW